MPYGDIAEFGGTMVRTMAAALDAGHGSLDMRELNFIPFGGYHFLERSETLIRMRYDYDDPDGATQGDYSLSGVGFKFGEDGIASGTVQSIACNDTHGLGNEFLLTGISVELSSLRDVAQTVSTADDRSLFASLLRDGNKIIGSDDNDHLFGYAGDDDLEGEYGDDTLFGGAGKDYLNGFAGSDVLRGGLGADVFHFASVHESDSEFGRDVIEDFRRGQHDLIDLKDIGLNGDQDDILLRFIGTKHFAENSDGLRYRFTKSGDTILEVNCFGEKNADMTIFVEGHIKFVASDFLL